MMSFLLVGVGGAAGALARFGLGTMIAKRRKMVFPLEVFLINVTGALLLGILTGSGAGRNTLLLLGDGFLGAFTTFSTFMVDGVILIRDHHKLSAALYICISILLGLTGFIIGFAQMRIA